MSSWKLFTKTNYTDMAKRLHGNPGRVVSCIVTRAYSFVPLPGYLSTLWIHHLRTEYHKPAQKDPQSKFVIFNNNLRISLSSQISKRYIPLYSAILRRHCDTYDFHCSHLSTTIILIVPWLYSTLMEVNNRRG